MIVVVMGVAGVGKTTIGQLLANRLACEFLDADDFHPPANVAKMAAGTPLDDADRWPWLEHLNALLRERAARGASAVLACSALKNAYRERLCRDVARCRLVYLRADVRVLRARLAARTHRYMPASLLDSQLATLEPPADALEVDAAAPPEHCAQVIAAALTRP
ncbi:MAG: gluconokinase [Sphingomonadaceae bacterium]